MDKAFCTPADEVLRALGGDRHRGLDEGAVRASREAHGANELARPEPIGWFRRIVEAFKEPMILLLVLALLIMVGVNVAHLLTDGHTEFAECVGVALAILLSVGISVGMEGRSAKAFEALRGMGADVRPRVLRGGKSFRIPQSELVVGDVMFVGTGDKLTADGRLLESNGLVADESALTGESAPVEKHAAAVVAASAPVAERPTMLYAGSYVTAGTGLMVVTAVGMRTEFGRIAAALADQSAGKTPLQERLAHLGKWVTLAGIVAAALVFAIQIAQNVLRHGELSWTGVGEAFISAIVLIVACVPEGLPTIVAMSLAINVLKMAKQNALVKKLIACETIGCVTFICSDKTGTLTENRMTLIALCGPDGRRVAPEGLLLENMCVNATADLAPDGKGFVGNPTEGALIVAAAQAGHDPAALREAAEIAAVEPFSSDTKRMVTRLGGAHPIALMKGSPEAVLAACALAPEARAAAEAAMAKWQDQACRVLAFAHAEGDGAYAYDGFAAIADPVRADVPPAIEACRTAGINVMMLTGDNLITATAIARSLGMLEGGHRAVTAAELEGLDDAAFAEALRTVRVIARSTPSVKLRVVRALKAQGESIAVTGDGINDAPAIKEADVGVAMGITGTEVTKEACDILLLDDAFATIVRAIRWGRGITDNFKRFILFQLTVNVSAVLVVLVAVILDEPPPFSALELLWINIIMDGPPALCLGLERMSDDLLRRKPLRRDAPLVSRGMALRMAVVGVFIAALCLLQLKGVADFLGVAGEETLATAVFTLFVFCQLANALAARRPEGGNPLGGLLGNPALLCAILIAAALQWVIVTYGGGAFGTVPLDLATWGRILLAAACVPLLAALLPRSRGA